MTAADSNLIDVLKQKIVELETAAQKDAARNQRASSEHERMLSELLTARKNVEILTGNVETLKSLAMQLAGQVEDANAQIATLKNKSDVEALKQRRDAAAESSQMRVDYEQRLEALRKELEASQATAKAMHDVEHDAELKAEVAVAKISAAKDDIILGLQQEMQVLRGRLAIQAAREEQQHPQKTPPPKSPQPARSASRRSQSSTADAAALPLPRRSVWDGSDSEVSAQHRTVLDLKVGINKDDVAASRWRSVAGSAGRAARYHVDVMADRTFLDTLKRTVDMSASPPRPSSLEESARAMDQSRRSVLEGDTVSQHRWAFMSATGEEIRVAVDVVPMLSSP